MAKHNCNSKTQGINASTFFAYTTHIIFLICFILQHDTNIHAQGAPGRGYAEIIIDSTYEHNKWGVAPPDLVYNFAAFITSFDSDDDNNNDGIGDLWGIPEWVAYEIKKELTNVPRVYTRPKWLTDDSLNQLGIVPNDATYAVSGVSALDEVPGNNRFVRGHMCPKDAADRISLEAGYNTHTVLNAVPQLQWQNNGIWKTLESQITDWADKYGRVWVICGPVFFDKTPAVWLGQDKEVKAAVPDAIFKLVIRETDDGLKSLAFIIPNIIKEDMKFQEYLTSISRIEGLTGLTFFTTLGLGFQSIDKHENEDLNTIRKKRKVINNF